MKTDLSNGFPNLGVLIVPEMAHVDIICSDPCSNLSLIFFQVGVKNLVVFINKADIVDEEMLDLVELEMIELLEDFGFDGENTPIIKGMLLLTFSLISEHFSRG